jgi:cyanophycinase-like exopeptidase
MPTAICNGFGFVPAGMLIDQHAIARGRYGRMLGRPAGDFNCILCGRR